MSACSESDLRTKTMHATKMMQSTIVLLREGLAEVTDPKAQALFETSAEVLEGLIKAFNHYEKKTEKAWQ
jgi:rubrerythrin